MRMEGDPLADQVITDIIEEHGHDKAREVFNDLIRDIDLPISLRTPSLEAYLQESQSIGNLITQNELNNSYMLFIDHGPKMLLALFYKSLPLLYTNEKGAKVLINTGRLAHNEENMEIFSRRIAETGQFLMDVLDNFGLRMGGEGIKSIQKIRLIHASVRHFVQQSNWKNEINGVPINQEDLVLTLLTFSNSILSSLDQLKLRYPQEQAEAYLKRWQAIGILMGIRKELIPVNRTDADWLLERILTRQAKGSREGKTLTKALIYFSRETIPGKIFDITPRTLIQFYVGDNYAKMLGAYSWWYVIARFIPDVILKIFNLGEHLETKSSRLKWVADKLSVLLVKAMVNYFNRYKDKSFQVRSELLIKWGV